MSACPKCGRELKITNLKPTCPDCGVNLLYYKHEESLEVDAINAELEHAKTQQGIDRAKASIFGSPLMIVRMVLLALAVGMFFLPLATVHIVGPYFDNTTTVNALEIYNTVSGMDFDGFFGLLGSSILGTSMIYFLVAALTIAVSAVCAVLSLVFSFLSCSPRGFSRNVTLCIVGIVSAIASIVMFSLFSSNITGVFPGLVESSVSFGAYLVIVGFVLVLAINIIIKKKNVPVKYAESYINFIPYEDFVEKFGKEKFDLNTYESKKDEISQARADFFESIGVKDPDLVRAREAAERAKEEKRQADLDKIQREQAEKREKANV